MTTTNRGLMNQVENTKQPGVAFNQMADVFDRLYGSYTVDFAADATLTLTQLQCDYGVLVITDSGTLLTGSQDVVFTDAFPPKLVRNDTAEDLTLLHSGGTGVTLPAGDTILIGCGQDDVVSVSGGGGAVSSVNGQTGAVSLELDKVTIVTEAGAFTATPATHAGLRKYVRAGGNVTFNTSQSYTAGEVYNIRATGSVTLSGTGVTLTAPSGGTLVLTAGMSATVVMTSSTAGDVIGQTVPA